MNVLQEIAIELKPIHISSGEETSHNIGAVMVFQNLAVRGMHFYGGLLFRLPAQVLRIFRARKEVYI